MSSCTCIGTTSKFVDGNILDLYIIDNYWGSYGLKSKIGPARYFVIYENLWFSRETSLQEKIKIPQVHICVCMKFEALSEFTISCSKTSIYISEKLEKLHTLFYSSWNFLIKIHYIVENFLYTEIRSAKFLRAYFDTFGCALSYETTFKQICFTDPTNHLCTRK